jgi:hypothetical protein
MGTMAAQVGSDAHRVRNYWTNLRPASTLQHVITSTHRCASLSVLDIMEPGTKRLSREDTHPSLSLGNDC